MPVCRMRCLRILAPLENRMLHTSHSNILFLEESSDFRLEPILSSPSGPISASEFCRDNLQYFYKTYAKNLNDTS